MIYAYVTNETCRTVSAEKRGAVIGKDETPVAKHGDYNAWTYGKRETAEMMRDMDAPIYRYRAAKAVSDLLGWR